MGSIPRGVGGPPPPGMSGKRGKLMCIKVRLLDDSVAVFHLGHKALGHTLMDEVVRHLNILEGDYFGLEFVDNNNCHCWLDMEKQILRQISGTSSDAKFHLIVKFYTPNPVDLEEEYTRYLLSLQIRRDLSYGHFVCAEGTAALLAAYLVQADCGDFSPDDYPDASYLSHTRFIPNQTIQFQQKVMEHHRKLVGLTPEESDLQLLEVARRCDFYGIKFHPAKDVEGTEASLAVMHLGIKVFHQLHCVSTFSWAKIRKLSFKRKKLLIKLHPDSYQYYKETIEFVFETRNECKNFWKKSVEHHAFFRCTQVEAPTKKDGKLFSKGSSFRYHGRTQKQLIDYVREHHKRREPFTRPLRSGYHTGVPSTTGYSAVVRRDRAHSSMPHVARADSDYARLLKRKSVVYGVNSTFSDRSLDSTENIKGILTQSTSSGDRLNRAPSSEYGNLSLHSTKTDISPSTFRSDIENNNSKRVFDKNQTSFSQISDGKSSFLHTYSEISRKTDGKPPLRPPSSPKQASLDAMIPVDHSLSVMDYNEDEVKKEVSTIVNIWKDLKLHEVNMIKDIDIITKSFRSRVDNHIVGYRILVEMFNSVEGIGMSQQRFSQDLEALQTREDEVLCSSLCTLLLSCAPSAISVQEDFLRNLPTYVSALHQLMLSNGEFREEMRCFEQTRECYLPIVWLLIKVLNRLLFWQECCSRIMEWLLSEGERCERALGSAREAVDMLAHHTATTSVRRESLYDFGILLEIENNMQGMENLSHPDRKLIRVGRVEVWCGLEFAPRLLLLFTDIVIFTYFTPGRQFQTHSVIQVTDLVSQGLVQLVNWHSQQCISLNLETSNVIFSTNAYSSWLDDIAVVLEKFSSRRSVLPSIFGSKRSDENEKRGDRQTTSSSTENSIMHVCWNRKATTTAEQIHKVIESNRCGYLLRKLRSTSGWQKLWAVQAHGIMFFYNSHKDPAPLASLPLLEYSVSVPTLQDNVSHKYALKLSYAQQHYFFRAEGQYSFYRWMECLRKACSSRRPLDALTALSLHL